MAYNLLCFCQVLSATFMNYKFCTFFTRQNIPIATSKFVLQCNLQEKQTVVRSDLSFIRFSGTHISVPKGAVGILIITRVATLFKTAMWPGLMYVLESCKMERFCKSKGLQKPQFLPEHPSLLISCGSNRAW